MYLESNILIKKLLEKERENAYHETLVAASHVNSSKSSAFWESYRHRIEILDKTVNDLNEWIGTWAEKKYEGNKEMIKFWKVQ